MGSRPLESLHGERVVLRRYLNEDAEALIAAVTASIEHLRPWMPWIQFEPQTIEQRRAWIEQCNAEWDRDENYTFCIVAPDDQALIIGGTGLHRRGGPGTIEIGYWVHADHIGHGIATESSRLLTDAAFTLDEIEAVEIHHDKANIASSAVPRKLGYRFVGEHPRETQAPAETGVHCAWAVTALEWRALRAAWSAAGS
jgi:ribosomal-protein-serine acetyltransferase